MSHEAVKQQPDTKGNTKKEITMCKCSHTSSEHEKLWTLLEDEQEARNQLLQNIDTLLGSNNQGYLEACQDVLIAVKDYMLGVQILTDGMRLQFTLPPTRNNDTEPYHMNFEKTCKAPETLRSITPEKS